MYKEICMLILNTYKRPYTGLAYNIYINTNNTNWFKSFALTYVYKQQEPKLLTSYLSKWEVMQRVATKDLVRITKQDSI